MPRTIYETSFEDGKRLKRERINKHTLNSWGNLLEEYNRWHYSVQDLIDWKQRNNLSDQAISNMFKHRVSPERVRRIRSRFGMIPADIAGQFHDFLEKEFQKPEQA